jgi:RNA polymerase sigma-70 factor, ECF subfamily
LNSPASPTDGNALAPQIALVYGELKRLAASQIRHERGDHTLSATGLVHEAYLRLAQANTHWESRAHFFGIAANAMRQVLVDHARAHRADKRGGDWIKLTLTGVQSEIEGAAVGGDGAVDVLDLDSALNELEARDPRLAKLVALRYFAGLSIEDTATTMGLSPATVKREWLVAKLFLKRKLSAS